MCIPRSGSGGGGRAVSQPGTLVYDSWIAMQAKGETDANTCDYNDFALARLNPADHAKGQPVDPLMPGRSRCRRCEPATCTPDQPAPLAPPGDARPTHAEPTSPAIRIPASSHNLRRPTTTPCHHPTEISTRPSSAGRRRPPSHNISRAGRQGPPGGRRRRIVDPQPGPQPHSAARSSLPRAAGAQMATIRARSLEPHVTGLSVVRARPVEPRTDCCGRPQSGRPRRRVAHGHTSTRALAIASRLTWSSSRLDDSGRRIRRSGCEFEVTRLPGARFAAR
jgi:hypothetical protein